MDAKDIQQFDKVSALFMPKRIDNLRPGVEECIGKRYVFMATWIIEQGEYKGQWAMQCLNEERLPFSWGPLSDLAHIRPAEEGEEVFTCGEE